ncbi:hypothetical protein, partial [Mesorhizobium captivum]|uniref:hypothetical protein n=2 Tax=Mesorhizobium captivum TaxID=3072319 RepID=UPI002A23E2D1
WGKGGSQPGCTSTILPLIGRHCKTDCGADVGLCWSKSDIPTDVLWNPSLIPEPLCAIAKPPTKRSSFQCNEFQFQI